MSSARGANGYRQFSESDIHRLRFLQRARGLGFSMQDCRELLSLYDDRKRSSADVKAIAQHRLEDIERKITELQSLRDALHHLVTRCHGDQRPDCPILDGLAGTHG